MILVLLASCSYDYILHNLISFGLITKYINALYTMGMHYKCIILVWGDGYVGWILTMHYKKNIIHLLKSEKFYTQT